MPSKFPKLIVTGCDVPDPSRPNPGITLTDPLTLIGSAPTCDIRLEGLDPIHAQITYLPDSDEYEFSSTGRAPTTVHGAHTRGVLRTGSRIELGDWVLVYYRAQQFDHDYFGGNGPDGAGAEPDPVTADRTA